MHPDRFLSPDPNIRPIAQRLYQSVAKLPIFAPHGHVDPALFSNPAASFGNPVELFILPDHYVTRVLYSNGIPLQSIGIVSEGQKSTKNYREIWKLFCANFYLFRATPTGLGLQSSLFNIFGIQQKLSAESADAIYDELVDKLSLSEYSPRALFENFNIEMLATTDSVTDRLNHHQEIKNSGWQANIVPTFRWDTIIHLHQPGWQSQIDQLAILSAIEIVDFRTYLLALQNRRDFFRTLGATATDFSAETAWVEECTSSQLDQIFTRALNGKSTKRDENRFIAHMLLEMARMSADDGMVMQFHAGILRNHDQPLYHQFGPDIGADIPVQIEFTRNLQPLLNKFGNHPNFQLILFTLDESSYTRELAPLAGHYPALKLGPPWWFNDSLNGITRYLEKVIEIAGLSKTAGFNDDTRGFCSIPARHDLWRRACANWLTDLLARHIIDEEDAHQMIVELSVGSAKRAYKFK